MKSAHRRQSRAGQVMVEYTMTAGLLLASLLIFAVFLYVFKEFGSRVLELVASEYP